MGEEIPTVSDTRIRRVKRSRDKAALLKLLRTPMRVNRLAGEARHAAMKQGFDDRVEALFAYFDIDEDWPELLQWRELALSIAGKQFAGCRTISRGIGGPSKPKRDKIKVAKQVLSEKFAEYRNNHSNLSAQSAATNFLKLFRTECGDAGLSKPKSFLQAMDRAEQDNGT
jgi:hypothetical protein